MDKKFNKLLEGSDYEVIDCALYRKTYSKDQIKLNKISNFIPSIKKEEILDNDIEKIRFLYISGIHENKELLPLIKINSKDFDNLNWIIPYWGSKCIIEPLHNAKEYLKHAMKIMSKNIEIKQVYESLGYHKLISEWVYIHGNVSIKESNISARLNIKTKMYSLLEDENADYTFISKFLNPSFIPKKISIPLLAITFLSPLNHFLCLSGNEPKTILFLLGRTGTKKSTLAALFLSFFGNFTNSNLPLSFRDTDNSIIEQSYLLKDTLVVIDDFHPSGKMETSSMNKKAQAIFRAYGDRVGKNRLKSDSTMLPAKPPRGNLLITGESLPDVSESGTARFITLEIDKNDIYLELLSELQESALKGELRAFMYEYIDYITSLINSNISDFNEETFINDLKDIFLEKRKEYQNYFNENKINIHARIPESIAWLYVGIKFLISFMKYNKKGIIEDYDQFEKEVNDILIEVALDHKKHLLDDKPTEKFIKKLNLLIMSNNCRIINLNNPKEKFSDSGFFGYKDENYYYFIPDIVHKEVKKLCDEQGESFSISIKTLLKQLGDDGIIEVKNNERTLPKRIFGIIKRVMFIKITEFEKIVS